jgi:hypothetical protein
MACFKLKYHHFREDIGESYENPQFEPVWGARTESWNYGTRSRGANHSIMTFSNTGSNGNAL